MRATMAQYHRVAVRAPERLPAPLDREGALQATTQMKGAWSGIPFAGRFATVSDLDGGVTVRVRQYFDPAEALDVVGLAE